MRLPILIAANALCPDCPPARAARAWVLGEAFWGNLLSGGLPFLVIAMMLSWFLRRFDRAGEPGEQGLEQGADHA